MLVSERKKSLLFLTTTHLGVSCQKSVMTILLFLIFLFHRHVLGLYSRRCAHLKLVSSLGQHTIVGVSESCVEH